MHAKRAVVVTDRTIDGKGNAVKSPFDFVYHASMEATAARVRDIVNDGSKAAYFGDLAGSGLDHVAFTWSFTTQPTVDDMKRIVKDPVAYVRQFYYKGAVETPGQKAFVDNVRLYKTALRLRINRIKEFFVGVTPLTSQ